MMSPIKTTIVLLLAASLNRAAHAQRAYFSEPKDLSWARAKWEPDTGPFKAIRREIDLAAKAGTLKELYDKADAEWMQYERFSHHSRNAFSMYDRPWRIDKKAPAVLFRASYAYWLLTPKKERAQLGGGRFTNMVEGYLRAWRKMLNIPQYEVVRVRFLLECVSPWERGLEKIGERLHKAEPTDEALWKAYLRSLSISNRPELVAKSEVETARYLAAHPDDQLKSYILGQLAYRKWLISSDVQEARKSAINLLDAKTRLTSEDESLMFGATKMVELLEAKHGKEFWKKKSP